jgi:MFS transporter, AAHS family, 4-hydroxybenzoate transporter
MPEPNTTVDVGHLLDEGRWGPYQKWLVVLVALTIVFDGIDNQLLGIVIPTVMKEWGVARSAFSPVVSLGYLGMMIGGLVAGLAGDRFGRRTALLWSMVVFGALTIVAARVDTPGGLAVLRLLAGIGLGGAMPNAAALAAEYVPLRQRPIAVTVAIVCVPLGATLAGLLGIRLLPVIGWRMLFVCGGLVPLAAAVVLRGMLPESPRFLARHEARWPELVALMARMGHPVDAGARFADKAGQVISRASIGALLSRGWRRDTLALWASFFFCLFSVYLGFSWLTSLLAGAGFDPAAANTGITAFNLGGVAGALLGGVAIARYGSRTSMLTMNLIAIVGALGLSAMAITPAAGVWGIIAMLALTGGMINGVQTTMYALAAHVYPSTVRATGVGTAVSIGRSGAILTGYAGTWAIDLGGAPAFFRLIAATMTVTFVALAVIERHVPRSRPGGLRTAA